jgi:hypothetical protein
MLKKWKNLTGKVDKKLLADGVLGRGRVLSIEQTGVKRAAQGPGGTGGPVTQIVCVVTLEVTLEGRPPYEATCRQMLGVGMIQLLVPGAMVVVHADPDDPAKVAIDVASPLRS